MSINGPLFDDEELPAWLRKAGITGGGRATPGAGARPEAGATGPFGASAGANAPDDDAIDLSWLDDVADVSPSAPAQPAEPLPWDAEMGANAGDSDADGLFGAAPFGGQMTDDAADMPAPHAASALSGEELPWQAEGAATGPTATPGNFVLPKSGPLPWVGESAAAGAESAPPAPGAPLAAVPWQTEGAPPAAPRAEAPTPPAAQTPLDLSLPWEPGAGDEADVYAAPAWDSGVDWLSVPAETPAAPAAQTTPADAPPTQADGEALPWDMNAEPTGDDADWLQEAAAPAESTAPAAPVAPQDDWLADFMAETVPSTAAPVEASDDWLNEPSGTASDDWLAGLESGAPEPGQSEMAVEPVAEPSADDWLSGFHDEMRTLPSEPTAETPAEPDAWQAQPDEPLALDDDWLNNLGRTDAPAEPVQPESQRTPPSFDAEPTPVPGLDLGTDDNFDEEWLAGFLNRTSGELATEAPLETQPGPPPEMQALEPSAEPFPDLFAELAAETPAPDDALPDLPQELPPAFEAVMASAVGEPPAGQPAEPPTLELPDLDVPDWFASAPAEAVPSAPAEMSAPVGDEAALDWMAELPPDWQTAPDAAPAAPAAEASSAAPLALDDDLLDWMREPEAAPDMQPGPADDAAPPDAEPADLPDWMRGMAPLPAAESAESIEPAAPAGPGPGPGFGAGVEGPLDWLGGTDADADEPAPGAEPLAEAEIPAWMRDIAPAAPTPMAQPVEDQETAAALDWLSDVNAGTGAPKPPAAQTPPSVSPFAVEPVEGPITESGELVMDLSSADIDALLNLPPSGEPPIPTADASALAQTVDLESDALNLDEILGPAEETPAPEPGLAGAVATAAAAAPELPPLEVSPEAARESLPGWIEQMQPSEVPVVIQVGDQKVRIAEKPVAQLDPQLQKLRDRSREVSAEAKKQAETPSSGPLSGISDAIIPIADQIPPVASAVSGMIIDDLEARRVRVLESLLGAQEEQMRRHVEQDRAEAEAAAQSTGKRTRRRTRARGRARFKLDRLIVTVFLALAVVAPFFTDAVNVFAPLSFADIPADEQARIDAIGAAVDLIQPSSPYVLIAFEFRPTGAGELDDLAVAVLRDVWRRGGVPVVVSTDASGAVHAEGLIARLANETATLAVTNRLGQPLLARRDFVVLGFVPGGAAGVRALYDSLSANSFQRQFILNVDIEGQPAGLDEAAWGALHANPVFLLAEGQDDVRNWAEQFRPRGDGGAAAQAEQTGAPRLIVLSSVGASAIAQTYAKADAARFTGPLIGLRGATLYAERRDLRASDEDTRLAAQRWQSTGLGLTAAAVAVLFGAALNGIRTLRRRRTRR